MEKEAMAFTGKANFADTAHIWEGGQMILAYLLGWQGIEEGKFDPDGIITSEQFAKVLLEALGYKQDVDFDYEHVLHSAEMAGIHYAPEGLALHNQDIATHLIGSLSAKVTELARLLCRQT